MRSFTVRSAVAALLILAARTQAQDTARLRTQLQASLDTLLEGSHAPGATAAVVLPDGQVIAVAAGFADTVMKERMTPQSRLPAGSTGKTFVAAIVLQLASEGRLGLDDPIRKWFGSQPWFARLPNHSDITVRMLLNHTSGLPDHVTQRAFIRAVLDTPNRRWKPEQLVGYILDKPPQSAPGAEYHYTDTNYILLGMIIERVTGSTYYHELERRILDPLGLRDIVPNDSRRVPGVVQGYSGGLERSWLAYGRDTLEVAPKPGSAAAADAMLDHGLFVVNPQFEWTGGGVSSTATDLARWAKYEYEARVYSRQLLQEAVQCTPRAADRPCYGLGVGVVKTRFGVRYGHGGFFPGYRTTMAYFPDQRVAIAIQTNTTSSGAQNFNESFVLGAMQAITGDSIK